LIAFRIKNAANIKKTKPNNPTMKKLSLFIGPEVGIYSFACPGESSRTRLS
jgi:hypothetical protein